MSTTSVDEENANDCCCVGCDNCLGRELKCANFGLSHPEPKLFVTAQWRCHPSVYVVYRCVVALYFTVWIILSGVLEYGWTASDDQRIKWFIYLTNWSYFLLTVSALFQAAVVGAMYCTGGASSVTTSDAETKCYSSMSRLYKLMWVLHNVAINASLVTSLAFWAFIYKAGMNVHSVDWNTHCVNTIYIVIDSFITAIPLRLLHFYQGIIFAAVYILFSLVYDLSDQTNALELPYIYKVLDWNSKPGEASLYAFLIGLVAVPLLWLILFALYKARVAIHRAVSH